MKSSRIRTAIFSSLVLLTALAMLSNTAAQTYPADVLNLTNWKVTLPTGTEGHPTEIKQPALKTYSDDNFKLVSTKDAVVFKASCGSPTTISSGYPRSELREMTNNGLSNAAWSSSSGGPHVLYIKQKITHLPVVKPHVVVGQIHDANDDVSVFRLEGKNLYITDGNTSHGFLVDNNYQLGTVFTSKLVVDKGKITYYYNDKLLSYSQTKTISGCYFKAGCYTQSSVAKGDDATAYGEVVIYELLVTHGTTAVVAPIRLDNNREYLELKSGNPSSRTGTFRYDLSGRRFGTIVNGAKTVPGVYIVNFENVFFPR
jgi:hypothetical protein